MDLWQRQEAAQDRRGKKNCGGQEALVEGVLEVKNADPTAS